MKGYRIYQTAYEDHFDCANMFLPDWHEYMTLREFKAQYSEFGKFTGCGWYITKADSLLILPGSEGEDKYNFYCWNDNLNIGKAFNQIVNAPVQVDDRD